ncbi:MAG: phosphodiesterase [Gammaproteobacteria bacterium]
MSEHHVIQTAKQDRVNLIQITDTHIMGHPDDRFDGVDTAATLAAVLGRIEQVEPAPDAILVTGDLVHDPETGAYDRLLRLLETVRSPVFCLPGNHDDPGMMHERLNRGPIRTVKNLTAGNWRILLLDTWMPGSHAGRLSKKEMQFLVDGLDAERPEFVLIALHHPPVSLASSWMDAMGLENADGFLSVIDRHTRVRAVIWGHAHQEYENRRAQSLLMGTPSTCVQFKPGTNRYIKDDRPPGFRQLFLYEDGSVKTRLQRVAA